MNKVIIESDVATKDKYIEEYKQNHNVANMDDYIKCAKYVHKRMLEEADLDNFEVHVFTDDYGNYVTW